MNPVRLARLFRWAWLWLIAHAPLFLSAKTMPRGLQKMTRAVACLIFLSAAKRTPARARKRINHPPSVAAGFRKRVRYSDGQGLRAAIGSRLRRRLRGRSPAERFAALLSALWHADALAGKLSKRLARRLTRLCAIMPVAPPSLCSDTHSHWAEAVAEDSG